MRSKLSVFWSPQHKAERQEDIQFIAGLKPYDILILEPDVQDVSDAHQASPESEITLRFWRYDDNNRQALDHLRRDPENAADMIVAQYAGEVEWMMQEARKRSLPFPAREQLICHLWNEPDSNDMMEQINRGTVAAVRGLKRHRLGAEALNVGTGHPAILDSNDEPDWSPLAEALDVVAEHNGYAVLHEYFNDLGITDGSVNPWHILRHLWAPYGPRYKIGEFGLEMLLNGRMGNHHGWQGIISGEAYVADHRYYLSHVRDDVVSVRTYMLDYRDPVWKTFDIGPIRAELIGVGRDYPFDEEDRVGPGPEPGPDAAPGLSRTIIDPLVAEAILNVESGASFGPDGRPIIRFETHIFRQRLGNAQRFHQHFKIADSRPWAEPQYYRRFSGDPWTSIHSGQQANEWEALDIAQSLDKEAALESTSMGRAQVMGFNHRRIGYPTASAMFEAFKQAEPQIIGFINFILSDATLLDAIHRKDWRTVAERYNGAGGVDIYAPRLQAAYEQLTA